MYDLIVIGGGPAGLTATIYAIRKRLNVLMVTRDLGGKTQWHLSLPWIEDYHVIRGLEVVNKFKSELEYLDFARHMEKVEKVEREDQGFVVQTSGGGELKAKSLIIATGAKYERLNVPGEKDFMMKGLCYSAISYAPLFIDRTTMVVGNGELAINSVAELATIGERVYLVTETDKVLGSPIGKKLMATNNVTVLKGYEVAEVKGDDFARIIVLKQPDGTLQEFSVDATFIEKGLIPNSQFVANLVDVDEHGQIKVDCGCKTNVPGIFAAGDVTAGFAEQVLIAVGEGAKAALSAYEYLLPKL